MTDSPEGSHDPEEQRGAAAMRQFYNLPVDATEEQLKEAQRRGRIEALNGLGLSEGATEEEVLAALDRQEKRLNTLEVLRAAQAEAAQAAARQALDGK